MKSIANCPSCHAVIDAGESPKLGSRVLCELCDHEWEIIWEDPVELDWPTEWIFNPRRKFQGSIEELFEEME